jgi:hypothetical protein
MSQPVKLSDHLVLDARLIAAISDRSIAGQIEFWAGLGRAIEPLLQGTRAYALRQAGEQQPLSELLSTLNTADGIQRVMQFLEKQPFPHYESVPKSPALVIRIEEDGTRIKGRFVNGKFVALGRARRRSKTARRKPEVKDRQGMDSP